MTIPTTPTIETLIARVFATRNRVHAAHWRTGSYAQHVALGEFYGAVIDSLDKIVECYQGQFGLVGDAAPDPLPADTPIAQHLSDEADWIAQSNSAMSRGSFAVSNLIDGLVADYRVTVYKLRFLA